jgi:hypothetical protein
MIGGGGLRNYNYGCGAGEAGLPKPIGCGVYVVGFVLVVRSLCGTLEVGPSSSCGGYGTIVQEDSSLVLFWVLRFRQSCTI